MLTLIYEFDEEETQNTVFYLLDSNYFTYSILSFIF